MKITFYSNKSDAIVVDKKINSISTINNAKIINETDILNPSIIVSRNFYDSLFSQANYLYIDKLKRYYFINNISFADSMIVIDCSVDVLMSYKDEIKKLYCTVKRNENVKNGYLNDDNYNVYSYENIVCKAFPKGLTDNSIILMTVGWLYVIYIKNDYA